jgi:hypothetical protein
MPDQRAAHDKADDDENDADFDEREALLSWIFQAPPSVVYNTQHSMQRGLKKWLTDTRLWAICGVVVSRSVLAPWPVLVIGAAPCSLVYGES